jgi:hypothetical protein
MGAGGATNAVEGPHGVNDQLANASNVRASVPIAFVMSDLHCNSRSDATNGATVIFQLKTATASACTTPGADGTDTTCTWSNAALTCTLTGTTAKPEFQCSDTANTVSMSTTQLYYWDITTTGTWSIRMFTCSWMECM